VAEYKSLYRPGRGSSSLYLTFLSHALRGDLGRSVLRQEPVTQEILRRFPATIELALAAMLFAMIVGIPAGVISAVRRGSWFDGGSMLVALTGVLRSLENKGCRLDRILDMPCGTGRAYPAFLSQCYNFFGSDISLEMMMESRKKLASLDDTPLDPLSPSTLLSKYCQLKLLCKSLF
jgi:hypothetical protein